MVHSPHRLDELTDRASFGSAEECFGTWGKLSDYVKFEGRKLFYRWTGEHGDILLVAYRDPHDPDARMYLVEVGNLKMALQKREPIHLSEKIPIATGSLAYAVLGDLAEEYRSALSAASEP